MSLTLYADHHVKLAIVEGLRRRGLDVVTALEDGADRLPDELLLARATELGRVLISADKDFLGITARWWAGSRRYAGVIRIRRGQADVGRLIEDIALTAESYTAEEMANRLVYVPL